MFASLHNRSFFSFLSATTPPEALAGFAARHAMPAIALTDLHGVYAAVPFMQACHKAGVRPIVGAEVHVALPTDEALATSRLTLTLLARNLRGFSTLCRLISIHHLKDGPLTVGEVVAHSEDMICLVGSGSQATGNGQRATGKRTAAGRLDWLAVLRRLCSTSAPLREAFVDRLYLELAMHTRDDAVDARRRAALADELGLPVVATCAARCLRREDAATLQAVCAIGTLTLLDQPHPDKPVGEHHLRTPAEMQRLFARRPDALENTLRIAEQCGFALELDRNRFPPFHSPDGRTAMQHLHELSVAGCRRRYVDEPPLRGIGGRRATLGEALTRLDRELSIIDQVHYAEYFLVFHEIVEYCRSRGIATLARGSAADSLVCYVLGVSHACPFRFDLPFDRFINPERAKFSKMADIDLDLPWDQREEVMRWVYDRWGHDRVAMIGLPHVFHGRAAVAELGKVYGLPAHEVYRVTKLLPRVQAQDLQRSLAASPETRDLPIREEPFATILRAACALEGLPRHWALHPCGLVVSPEPLTNLMPVQRSPRSFLVAQYDMNVIEELGFVKIDLLGQAGLSVLRDATAEIRRTEGVDIDLYDDVDFSDEATWRMIATGDARGVHHIESPAMTSLIRQCHVRDIDCLTTIVAIIRPGAANQGKKDAFARRYQGFEPPSFVHPAVEPVLSATYGLMVFEEHILQVATDFAGMNLGRADVLRRALNKENLAMIRELEIEFRRCAREKGRDREEIDAVWKQMEGFRGFMFNKAHSAEYAVEAFQGAWLKRRWPAHYLAAVLSNYRGFYAGSPTLPQILYVLEAMRLGARFLPPCVNRSREKFAVEGRRKARPGDGGTGGGITEDTETGHGEHGEMQAEQKRRTAESAEDGGWFIRLPVSHIHGLSAEFVERHLAARAAGAFGSLDDFLARCTPTESEAQLLLDAGALDGFGSSRPALFWMLAGHDRLRKRSGRTCQVSSLFATGGWDAENTEKSQSTRRALAKSTPLIADTPCSLSAFSASPSAFSASQSAPPVALTEPDAWHVAKREMELLGFPVTIDPLAFLSRDERGRTIDWAQYTPVSELNHHHYHSVRVCGLIVADRVNRATTGDLMKFVSLADRSGCIESILFPDTYQQFGHLTIAHPILEAVGVVEPFENGNGCTLRVTAIRKPVLRPA
jgi:DNA-directed DNA polymerase III PolC